MKGQTIKWRLNAVFPISEGTNINVKISLSLCKPVTAYLLTDKLIVIYEYTVYTCLAYKVSKQNKLFSK